MPWCPKCKSEYREGFTTCAGCGSQLVEEAPVDEPKKMGSQYQDSSRKADENRLSAWILLIVGSLGLAMVILGVTEVLPFNFGNPYLFYGVMTSVFVLFIVAGAVAMKDSGIFARKAESENSLRSTLLNWCRENLHAEQIDSEVYAEGAGEEVLYFSRTAYIRERLNRQFINLDQDFLQRFVDDHVYEMIFLEDKEDTLPLTRRKCEGE